MKKSENFRNMLEAITEYRTRNNLDAVDEIGCIVLTKPFFFERSQWIESPSDWSKSIVSGKKYETSSEVGKDLYTMVSGILAGDMQQTIREIDALFDGGFISFDDSGSMLVSKKISYENAVAFGIATGKRISLTNGNRKNLKYHREKVYKE